MSRIFTWFNAKEEELDQKIEILQSAKGIFKLFEGIRDNNQAQNTHPVEVDGIVQNLYKKMKTLEN